MAAMWRSRPLAAIQRLDLQQLTCALRLYFTVTALHLAGTLLRACDSDVDARGRSQPLATIRCVSAADIFINLHFAFMPTTPARQGLVRMELCCCEGTLRRRRRIPRSRPAGHLQRLDMAAAASQTCHYDLASAAP
jgi:hypothetical protein